jgi:hypothetical protein
VTLDVGLYVASYPLARADGAGMLPFEAEEGLE